MTSPIGYRARIPSLHSVSKGKVQTGTGFAPRDMLLVCPPSRRTPRSSYTDSMLRRATRPRFCVLLLASAALSQAAKLPLKIYTAADGLAHNSVNRIVHDGRGYLWFCTSEGLSRFDGYEFHSYGRRDGLPHRVINDVLETRSGELWVATAGGLCQYEIGRASCRERG